MNIDEIEVSIFCVAYNHEKYIRKALDSFIMQKTTFRYEIIVHDDASTDRTASIIEEYRKKYPNLIKPIYEKENQYSKNNSFVKKMLNLSKGKYIANCDGDDFWIDEYKLQKQYEIMTKNSGISIVVSKVICCEEDGAESNITFPNNCLGISGSKLIDKREMINLFISYPFHTSSYFTLRTVGEKRIEKEFCKYINGDQAIILESILEGNLYYIDEPLSCRRLSSIGGWNQRIKQSKVTNKLLFRLKWLYGLMFFDIELKKQNNHISRDYISKEIPYCGCMDKMMFKEIRSYFRITFADVTRNGGLFKGLFFTLSIVCPKVAFAILKRRYQ